MESGGEVTSERSNVVTDEGGGGLYLLRTVMYLGC